MICFNGAFVAVRYTWRMDGVAEQLDSMKVSLLESQKLIFESFRCNNELFNTSKRCDALVQAKGNLDKTYRYRQVHIVVMSRPATILTL